MVFQNISQADLLPFLASHLHTFDIITGMDIIEHFGKDELVEVLTAVRNSLKPREEPFSELLIQMLLFLLYIAMVIYAVSKLLKRIFSQTSNVKYGF